MGSQLPIGDFAFGAAVAFLFGVFAASLGWGVAATTVVAIAVATVMTMATDTLRKCIVLPIVLAVVLFGSFYFHFFTNARIAAFDVPLDKKISFRVVVTEEPKFSEKYVLLAAQAEPPYSGAVTVFADSGAVFHYGDLIRVMGIVNPARQSGEDPAIFPQALSLVASHRGFILREWMIDFKSAILQKFNDVLPADEAALLGGMTLGGTAGMSSALKDQMALSGTSYLAAMYGYKINILIFGGVGLLGGWVSRRKRFFLMLTLLALFVAMAGAEASVVRAAVMGCIALSARELGRMPSMRNAIALSAAGMALFDPTIVAQAGFLLSFLSLVGIVCLGPALKRFFRWENDHDDHDRDYDVLNWKNAVIMSIASLLPIVPVLMASFGQFSAMAFISNALVFPAILPLMLLGCAVAITGFLSYSLAFFVTRFAEIPIWYELGVIRFFSVIVVPLPQIFTAAWIFILYYAALAWFAYHYSSRSSPRRRGSVLPLVHRHAESADSCLRRNDELRENDGEEDWDF
jgi:ComEC/Rec2-related protein